LSISNPAVLVRLLLAGAILWLAVIFVAPFGIHWPYVFGSFVCHQRPGRSFWIGGAPMPVCARCTGLYLAAAAGAALAIVSQSRALRATQARVVLLVAAIPTAATLIIEWLGLFDPGSAVRFLAALPLGGAAAWVVAAAAQSEKVR
jgi:uncharacterized membrane protein